MSDTLDDELIFAPEQDAGGLDARHQAFLQSPHRLNSWPILVVDDEDEVHSITSLVLSKVSFRDRPLELISAYSAQEALEVLAERPDIALILLDVVMESEQAGLDLVDTIRNTLNNPHVRIILRTGQPGQAPERDVILNYDINDYKAKSELTAGKLFTSVIAALRAFEDIMAIDTTRRGLELVIDASASLHRQHSLEIFSSGVLTQICAILDTPVDGILVAKLSKNDSLKVLAGAGRYSQSIETADPLNATEKQILKELQEVLTQGKSNYHPDHAVIYLETTEGHIIAIYIHTRQLPSPMDRKLLELFCSKISIAFENVNLFQDLKRTHRATVMVLAHLAEYKDYRTGEHVLRVANMARKVADRMVLRQIYRGEMTEDFVEQIGLASILHDVGKVSTPDHILQKPGKLTENEWAVMQGHAEAGGDLLRKAANMIHDDSYLTMGAEIAHFHHEHYDGGGYPMQLAEEAIPLSARIVAVADVYDALTHRRPYKEPWPHEEAIAYIAERAGSQFDPQVVNCFLEVVEEVREAGSESLLQWPA